MHTKTGYSERYEQALRLAAIAHRDQDRKGGNVPYITHPVHVSAILLRHGFSPEVVIAGLLHDVVEDQDVSLEQIKEDFGEDVAEIVDALSERKEDVPGQKRPWAVRKRESLEKLRRARLEVVAVKAADTLHNARCTVVDARREGPRIWQRFNSDAWSTLRYYRQVLHLVRERLGEHPLVGELADAVDELARVDGETPSL